MTTRSIKIVPLIQSYLIPTSFNQLMKIYDHVLCVLIAPNRCVLLPFTVDLPSFSFFITSLSIHTEYDIACQAKRYHLVGNKKICRSFDTHTQISTCPCQKHEDGWKTLLTPEKQIETRHKTYQKILEKR